MFIQFGIVNLKYLYIFVTPIIFKLDRFLGDHYYDNKFYNVFIEFLSLTLCGTIHLLIIFLPKSDTKRKSLDKSDDDFEDTNYFEAHLIEPNELIKKEVLRRKRKKQFLYILFLTSLEMSAVLIQVFFKKYIIVQFNFSLLVILELIDLIIFSLIFLNYKLYRHQYISLIIFLICNSIFFIQSMEKLDIGTFDFIKSFLYYCFMKHYIVYMIFLVKSILIILRILYIYFYLK